VQEPRDLVRVLLCRLPADVRVRARAEALRELCAKLELHGRGRGVEGLHVRVGDDELDPRELRRHHPAHRVAAATAEADDLDLRSLRHLVELEERAPCAIPLHQVLLPVSAGGRFAPPAR